MKSDRGVLKHFFLAFAVALIGYIAVYSAMEHRRTRNGPWHITFTNDASGNPGLVINQPKLGITNLEISFANEKIQTTNFVTLALEQPRETPFDVSFGRCVFMDLMSLPGTLVLEVFGHEIQLLPRVLTIDKTEHAWVSATNIVLSPRGR